MTTGERIKALRTQKGMTQEELGEKVGVKTPAIYKYENGLVVNLKRSTIEKLAEVLDTTPSYLMGFDDVSSPPAPASNLIPIADLHMKKIPLIGTIACGTPILAEENITDYIDAPGHIRADFALMCRGDSMIGANIRSGDIVFIRQQPEVCNGQIAAVLVGDEATLKRLYHSGNTVTLLAENPDVAPLTLSGSELESVRVIGLAVAFMHEMEA